MEGKAIIFSAPSGSGKTTIVQRLLKELPSLRFSISSTTRSKRPGELDGVHYYFLSAEEFRQKISDGELLEWEEVYQGTFYGTLKAEVEQLWAKGYHVVFDVDVKGGLKLKEKLQEKALALFVKVPSIEVLEERLTARNTEDQSSLQTRINKARQELLEEVNFDEVVINEDLEEAVKNAYDLIVDFIEA